MLCYVMLCYVMLCHVMFCYIIHVMLLSILSTRWWRVLLHRLQLLHRLLRGRPLQCGHGRLRGQRGVHEDGGRDRPGLLG